jgi:signal-transduction protein with cAMP-binding, CBS, and nucleotidyltransferase domain
VESPDPTGSYRTPSFEHARVADAMRARALRCDPQTTIVTVAQRMASAHVHAIVVLREIVDLAGAIGRRRRGIITDGVLLVHPNDRLTDIAERMLDQHTSRAIVVEPRTDRPVGVLSILGWGRG